MRNEKCPFTIEIRKGTSLNHIHWMCSGRKCLLSIWSWVMKPRRCKWIGRTWSESAKSNLKKVNYTIVSKSEDDNERSSEKWRRCQCLARTWTIPMNKRQVVTVLRFVGRPDETSERRKVRCKRLQRSTANDRNGWSRGKEIAARPDRRRVVHNKRAEKVISEEERRVHETQWKTQQKVERKNVGRLKLNREIWRQTD